MTNKLPCFMCKDGHYEPINQTYAALYQNRNTLDTLSVPDIDVLTCDKCGDECLDSENSKKIDKARDEYRKNK
jgi:hypothetical protein